MNTTPTKRADIWTCTKCGHYMDGPTATANPPPCMYCALRNSHDDLVDALKLAIEHLEYCNYGDAYESECARDANLPGKLDTALAAGKEVK